MASNVVDDSSVNSLRAKIDGYLIGGEPASNEAPMAKIKRVPKYLRGGMPGADEYFEPMVLYLGPFHRGKAIPEESKQLKKKVASIFMRAIGDSNHCFETCKKIYDKIDSLMKCYGLVAEEGSSERTRIWKEESSWMLFEDGCATLYFICRKDERFTTSTRDVTVPVDHPGIATEDILKLENQIPFEVLTLLMESAFNVAWRSMIDNFITFQILRIRTRKAQNLDEVSASRIYNDILVADRLREVTSNSGQTTTALPPAEVVELEAQQSSPSRSHPHRVLQAPPSSSSSSSAAPVHLLQHLRERLVERLPSRVSAPSRPASLFTRYWSELMSELMSDLSRSSNSAATSLERLVGRLPSRVSAPSRPEFSRLATLLQRFVSIPQTSWLATRTSLQRLVGRLSFIVSASSRPASLFTTYSSELMSEFSHSSNSAATSLKSRNIHLYPVHFENTLTNISCNITFKHVNIPSIAISTSSKSILMNLAADEVSSDIPNKLEISSFLHFLDNLVDSPEDAKVLREANVIHNFTRNDQEAADFLNDAAALLPTNADLFGEEEKKIQYLLENSKKWIVQLINEYFSSPWKFIAVSGGLLILSLAMLQTYLTVFPIPKELLQAEDKVSQVKVIRYLMERMFTAVLLPFPLFLTVLFILSIVSDIMSILSDVPIKERKVLAALVTELPIAPIYIFGAFAIYWQFHKLSY